MTACERAPTYFEFIEGKPELEVLDFGNPEEIKVVERALTQEEFDALKQLFEALA